MKIWVTGGSGSLGVSLLKSLRSTHSGAQILSPNHSQLALEDSKAVHQFVSEHKPTHVIHLAAQVFGIAGHKENPAGSLLRNTVIDNSVFSALNSNPPQWVYYASTVAAYGFPYVTLPLIEEEWLNGDPHDSEYGYAMAKRHALSYLEILHKVYSTKFVYGLTTNLFGTGDRFLEGRGHVVISLLEKAALAKKENTKLEVWGSGLASRDFLSTTDASSLILDMFDTHVGVVNVASGQEITIASLAEEIVEIFELSQGSEFVGFNEGITNRVCSTKKLREYAPSLDSVDSILRLREEIEKFKKITSH